MMRTLTIVLACIAGLLGWAVAQNAAVFAQPESQPEKPGMKSVDVRYSKSAFDITRLGPERIAELATSLTDEEAKIILKKGTEPAFCGNLLDNKMSGLYLCRLCSLPLFSSVAKFDSGTGWPSFYRPFDPAHIEEVVDRSHGMVRTEILCQRCGGHLGHVFDDSPQTPTGRRYCLNSASMVFHEAGKILPKEAMPVTTETAYFAGGCFWGVEEHFQNVPGVIDSISGYMGGTAKDPTYRQVCTGTTGHAETVKVVYDPARVTYDALLEAFFKFHDPTQVNRQGPDVGTQYRSAIFAATPEQLAKAKEFLRKQSENPRLKGRKLATQLQAIEDAGPFYEAEEYHQDYHVKNGGACPLPDW